MDPFGIEFGKTIGQLVTEYRTTFAWVALVWHLSTFALLYLIFRYGNRYRRVFAAYFALNYLWLVAFVGVWMSVQLYERMGTIALAVYGATPVFLLIILYQWYRELRNPRLDLDFRNIEKWRLLVAVPMVVWGLWYPPYIFGVRLVFDPAELLFGAYGLMGCPVTMVALSLLFLKYPAGNRTLFNLLTAYAVMVGAAMVALLYVPDIPFFFLGLASLALIVRTKLRGRKGAALPKEAEAAWLRFGLPRFEKSRHEDIRYEIPVGEPFPQGEGSAFPGIRGQQEAQEPRHGALPAYRRPLHPS